MCRDAGMVGGILFTDDSVGGSGLGFVRERCVWSYWVCWVEGSRAGSFA